MVCDGARIARGILYNFFYTFIIFHIANIIFYITQVVKKLFFYVSIFVETEIRKTLAKEPVANLKIRFKIWNKMFDTKILYLIYSIMIKFDQQKIHIVN